LVLSRVVGDILMVVVRYSMISGTHKTMRSTREQLAGTRKEPAGA
jgi:hypothetical protein